MTARREAGWPRPALPPASGILAAVSWLEDHQTLTAVLVLVALVLAGLAVLAVRGLRLYRESKAQMRRVQQPVATLTSGIADAERRVGRITAGSDDLSASLERVGADTAELRVLVKHASEALRSLRAPLRYLGR